MENYIPSDVIEQIIKQQMCLLIYSFLFLPCRQLNYQMFRSLKVYIYYMTDSLYICPLDLKI